MYVIYIYAYIHYRHIQIYIHRHKYTCMSGINRSLFTVPLDLDSIE